MEDLIRGVAKLDHANAFASSPILDCLRVEMGCKVQHPLQCSAVCVIGQYQTNCVLVVGRYETGHLHMSVFSAVTKTWEVPIDLGIDVNLDDASTMMSCSTKSNCLCIVTNTRAYYYLSGKLSNDSFVNDNGFGAVAMSPCGGHMAYIDGSGTNAYVYDRTNKISTLVYSDDAPLYIPSFTPSGERLAIMNDGGQVLYFETSVQYPLVLVVNSFPTEGVLLRKFVSSETVKMPENPVQEPPRWIALSDDNMHCLVATKHHLCVYLTDATQFIFDVPSMCNGFVGKDFYAIIDCHDTVLFYDEKNNRRFKIETKIDTSGPVRVLQNSRSIVFSIDDWENAWVIDGQGLAHHVRAVV